MMITVDSILDLFVTRAYAQSSTPAPAPSGGGTSLLLMLVVFIGFIYFTVWRPQSKRAKEQRDMLNGLAKGDEVVTAGGMLGKITKLTDTYVVLAVSDQAEIMLQKTSISSVLPKGTMKSV